MNDKEFKEYVTTDLLKTFDWLEYDSIFNVIHYKDCIVVNLIDLDVNFKEWHKSAIQHTRIFKFDGQSVVPLTAINYGLFKRVLKKYERLYIKGE